jgi:hypothetical protein
MPFPDKYRSTGRPPGKYLRHSSKEIFLNISGSPSPPFDIFSMIEKINNNNIICYYDNGGIICNEGVLVDSKAATPATINYKTSTSAEGISTEDGEERLADRFESNRSNCKYKYKFNIDGISTTTAATPAPATMAEGISNEGGEDTEAPGLSEWFADRFESNRCNYKYKYKFNIDGISTTTTTTNAPATPATATINYKTSTEGTSNEGGEEAEAVAGLSERFANLFESNHINKYKFNIDGISTTTPATTTTNHKTSAEGISNEDGEAGLSVWSTDRIESNQFNSGTDQIESTQFWYKFNIKGISTTTTTIAPATTATPATPATATINYKTSAEGISNEGGEEAEAAAGLSEWFESNQCNSISNNNNSNTGSISTSNKDNFNETSHLPFIITLLCLIIIKSFSPKEFKTAPKEKQQQQQHYHGKQRHQFHLEQQQKHQYFKQHHNVERMTASIVLKLTLVAWDMWTYRNGF